MIARRHFRKVLRAEKLEARIVLNGSMPGDLDSILPLADGAVGPALSDSAVVVTTDQVFPTSKAGLAAKLGPVLAAVRSEFRSHQIEAPQLPFQSRQSHLQISDDLILVQAVASGDPGVLLADLDDLGMQGSAQFGAIVSGRIPLDMLDDMAALESLQFASPTANPRTNVGLTTSQGDVAMNADAARATFGVDGSGVKIGVLSDSFDTGAVGSYATDVASGDLPAGIQVLDDLPGGTDEGRGMLQLIHDVAPGADLAFHTAFNGIADFAQGIVDLADAGADVIIDDVIYFEEPMFQDGAIAQAVDTVVASGVSYFSSAGNGDRQSYESAFVDSGEDLFVDDGSGPAFAGDLHDFDPTAGVDYMQSIYVPFFSGIVMSFQWDDPFFSVSGGAGADSDLDIFIVSANGTIVYGQSTTRNIGNDAVEVLQFTNTVDLIGQFNIMITNFDGPAPGLMKYLWYGPVTVNEYGTASSTIFGHANAAGAQAVGAAAYNDTPAFGQNPALLEPFSSAGGTPIIFDTAGNLLPTPEIRLKPEFVAPDGANTTFFPQGNDTDGDGFPNFFGTSAAAPHAGAVAALMLEANPSLTPAEIYTALQSTALDMDAPGFDHDTGYGLIQADQALGTISLVPRLAVSIDAAAIGENGGSTTATVTRWGVDTSALLNVTLGSNDTSEVDVPAGVTILAGAQSASFPIDAVDDLLSDGTQTVTITATAGGLLDGSDTLQVTDDEPQIISQWASTIIGFSSEWILGFPGQWNAIQALGPPDTFTYGDFPTAWAASSADGSGVEYLTLGYATPVFATGLIVRETFNPGFVAQVDVREAGTSTLHTVWTGSDPSLPGTVADFEITWPATAFQVDAVKVTINSNNTIGDFEEIDAVRLDGWDQQPPTTVTIAATDPAAAENPLNTGTFTVTRTDTDGDLTVFYSIDPSSTAAASDYVAFSGFVQIDDGQSSATITLTPVDDAEEEGNETLTLTLDVGAGYQVGSPAGATVTIADDDLSATDINAMNETPVDGTVSGDLSDTFFSDNFYESITEETYAGNKRSRLQHEWTFDVPLQGTATFYVEAYHDSSVENFDFDFSVDDGANWTTMLTVTKSADDGQTQSFVLPSSATGEVIVHVVDTDRSRNENSTDTIFVDHMFISIESGGPELPQVTVVATDSNAAEEGLDPGVFTVTRTGGTAGDLVVEYTVTGSASEGIDFTALSGTVTIPDGQSSETITVTPIDDADIDPAETVIVTVDAVADVYTVGSPGNGLVTIADNDSGGGGSTNAQAVSETTVSGTVTAGDYTDTFSNDGVFEIIQERQSGGKPSNRYSFLVHKWTFSVTGGDAITFFVEAFHSINFEGDDFTFAYSTDDVSYTNMLTVSKTADDNTSQSFALPNNLSGTVYIRVMDTDQTPGNKTLDTVFIDQMYIETFQALHAADINSGAIEGAAALTPAQLAPAVEQAIAYWAAWGIDSSRLDALSRTQIQIADLGGSLLGMASSSGQVWIDRDAAIGYDLGTVVAHEFGHVLGFDHNDRRDVMAARLLPSIPKAIDRIAERRSGELAIDSFWSDALPSPADARYTVLQTRRADDLKPASVTRLDRRRDAVDSIFANFTGPRRPKDLPARQDSRRRARLEHEFKQSHVEELKLLADTK